MTLSFRSSIALTIAALGLGLMRPAQAQTAYVLSNTADTLLSFDVSNPGTVTTIGTLSGASTSLNAIDFRPSDGKLYGYDRVGNTIVTVNTTTAVTTLVSTLTAGTTTGSGGIDFNPNVNTNGVLDDRLRLVDINNTNLRANVNTGAVTVDTPFTYLPGDPNAGVDPDIYDVAYTNNDGTLATGTQEYGIDINTNALVLVTNPNGGTLQTIGALGVDATIATGFDIFTNANGVNFGYASFRVGANNSFYSINLGNGAATLIGSIGGLNVRGLAVQTLPVGSVGAPAVPEPGSLALLGGVFVVGAGFVRKRRSLR